MKTPIQTVQGNPFSLSFDADGNFNHLVLGKEAVDLPFGYTTYELDGMECLAERPVGAQGLQYRLATKQLAKTPRSAVLTVSGGAGGTGGAGETDGAGESGGGEIRFHVTPEPPGEAERAALSFFLPETARIHIAEWRNTGRLLDRSMPDGETYTCDPLYNFVLVELRGADPLAPDTTPAPAGGFWLRLRSDHNHFNSAGVKVERHKQHFSLTFSWRIDGDARLALFPSMQAALADFQAIIERDFGALKLRDPRRAEEAWVHNTRMTFTIDMIRPTGEIVHDYHDLTRLAYDLKAAGCPADTFLYLPGWQGRYDAIYPTCWPAEELGGEDGFREMVDAVHACGYRVMIHTNGWGIDPYHPDIDRLEKFLMRYPDGGYIGWQTDGRWLPRPRSGRVTAARIPIQAPQGGSLTAGRSVDHLAQGARSFALTTVPITDRCETLLTLGGLGRFGGRVRLSAHGRSIRSPEGWFAEHDAFDYPFPLLLEPGENAVQVEVSGEGQVDWSGAWYAVREAFMANTPYDSWTAPILWADTHNPEFIDIFVGEVARVVKTFGVDAVHIDATWLNRPELTPPADKIIQRLQAELPGTVLGSEAILSFDEMSIWGFSQDAALALVNPRRRPAEQGSTPLATGHEALYAWLDQPSEVCAFARDYYYAYPHLVGANSFVPLGKIANHYPERKIPLTSEEQFKIVGDSIRLGHLPGLRLNYRKYGLDPETRQMIKVLFG